MLHKLTDDVIIANCAAFQNPTDALPLSVISTEMRKWDDSRVWKERLTRLLSSQREVGSLLHLSRKDLKTACITLQRERPSIHYLAAVSASSEHHPHEALWNTTCPDCKSYWSSEPGPKDAGQTLLYCARRRHTVFKVVGVQPYTLYYRREHVTRTYNWGSLTMRFYLGGKLPMDVHADRAEEMLQAQDDAQLVYEGTTLGSVLRLDKWVVADWIIVSLNTRLCEEYRGLGWYFCVEKVIANASVLFGKADDKYFYEHRDSEFDDDVNDHIRLFGPDGDADNVRWYHNWLRLMRDDLFVAEQ